MGGNLTCRVTDLFWFAEDSSGIPSVLGTLAGLSSHIYNIWNQGVQTPLNPKNPQEKSGFKLSVQLDISHDASVSLSPG